MSFTESAVTEKWQSPLPYDLMDTETRNRRFRYPGNRTECMGVTQRGDRCGNKPSKTWAPEWLWCGRCFGHRYYYDRYVKEHDYYSEEPYEWCTDDVVEHMWHHPDLWVRLKAVRVCAPSFVTPERAQHMLENDPHLVNTFVYSKGFDPNIDPSLLAYYVCDGQVRTIPSDLTDHSDPFLLAAAHARSTSIKSVEEYVNKMVDTEVNRNGASQFPFKELTEIEAAKRLKFAVKGIQYHYPNFDEWEALLFATAVPHKNFWARHSSGYCLSKQPLQELHDLRCKQAQNLDCLLRAALQVAKTEISDSGPLTSKDVMWSLMLLRLVWHATATPNALPKDGSLERGHKPPICDSVAYAAVTACELFTLVAGDHRLPAGLISLLTETHMPYAWPAHWLAGSAAVVANNDKKCSKQISQTLTDIHSILWNYAAKTEQNYEDYRYTERKLTAYISYQEVSTLAFDVLQNSGAIWKDVDIAKTADTIFAIDRNWSHRLALTHKFGQALHDILLLPNAGHSTKQSYLKTRKHLWKLRLIEFDEKRALTNNARLLSDNDMDKLADSTDIKILLALAASPHLPCKSANKIALHESKQIRQTVLMNQPSLSQVTLTMLAFDSNKQIASEAAKRLNSIQST